jgi:hypothetical protein
MKRDESLHHLPVAVLRQVDRLARAFEVERRAGRSAPMNEWLGKIDASGREALLAELLLIEIVEEQRRGLPGRSEANWNVRFPGRESTIARIFEEAIDMSRAEIRYCIHCGQMIGLLPACPNPQCDSLPNFYRNISEPARRKPGATPPAATSPTVLHFQDARENAARPHDSSESVEPPSSEAAEPRRTLPLGAASASPIAFLRPAGEFEPDLPLSSGTNEVGARRPATIIIDRADVSSRHATIVCEARPSGGVKMVLTDHGSTNGSFVNGTRVEKALLCPGDRIRFGAAEFELIVSGSGGG